MNGSRMILMILGGAAAWFGFSGIDRVDRISMLIGYVGTFVFLYGADPQWLKELFGRDQKEKADKYEKLADIQNKFLNEIFDPSESDPLQGAPSSSWREAKEREYLRKL